MAERASIRKVVAVSFLMDQDNRMEITICHATIKRGKFVVESIEYGSTIEDVLSKLPANVPVLCHFDGSAVLHRKVKRRVDHAVSEYFSVIVPNADLHDFYCQYVLSSTTEGFFSLVRKSVIDPIIDKLKESDLVLCEVTFGPFAINDALHFLPAETNAIDLPGYALTVTDHRIADFNKTNPRRLDPITLGDVVIEARNFIPYSQALLFCLKSKRQVEFIDPKFDEWQRDFKHKLVFVQLLKVAVLPIFLVASVMLFYNSHVTNENEQLTARYKNAWKEKVSFDTLAHHEEQKNALLQKFLITPGSCSYYADRIGASVPEYILLTTLEFFPENMLSVSKRNMGGGKIPTIHVSGECQSPAVLAHWTDHLMQLKWVQRIENQAYQWNIRQNIGQFSFVISIREL